MNKKDFLSYLDSKLIYLVDTEKSKEIEKYSSVIDNYVSMGQTEEAAISSFGNVDDLVKAVYLSRGLDYKKIVENKTSIKGFKGAFKTFVKEIQGSDKKSAKNALLFMLYMVLLIIFLKVIFILVRDNGEGLFNGIFTGKYFSKIYYIVFEVLYVVTSIFVFMKMFTKRFSK